MGVQAVPPLPAVLSNQTGYPSYYCDNYTERMEQIMDEWEKRGFSPDGIYTGFLADEEQADKILDFLRRKRRPWCWWIRLWEIMAVLMGFIQKASGTDGSAGGKRTGGSPPI